MTQATLALRATQQTALTPRLQQSVRLLQLSSNDFALELEQALATNPFLEVPGSLAPVGTLEGEGSWGAALSGEASLVERGSAVAPGIEGLAIGPHVGDGDAHGAADGPDHANADVPGLGQAGGDPFDFTSFGERSGDRDAVDGDVGSWAESIPTLRMHLHEELSGRRLGERDLTLAELVIEAIDDDGYLRQDLDDVVGRFAFDPPVDADEIARALTLVQGLGPPGIAARGVSECLALQLDALAADGDGRVDAAVLAVAAAIVAEHLERLARRDWSGIRKKLGCALDTVTRAADLIRRLDPRPGSAFGGAVAQSVVPDVIVRRVGRTWHADINPAVVPRLSLNRVYAALFHESRGGDRHPLGQQLQEARWFLRNAEQRFVTIRRVARVIVAEQAAFLDYGDIAIKPLLLRQVADQLDLHESTISRAIGNKFMATPRGVFPFKHFFSRKLATVSGGSCSAASIRAAMRELIDREDRNDPMSDVVLAKRLTEQGLCVARRTVTKYRGLMRIAPVEMRRAPGA